MLSTKQFTVVENDPTKPLESKIQRTLRKLKSKITDQEYKHLYPTGSQPGKFYSTAKMHKLPVNGNHNDLPLRPIVSNINTSTCNVAKFLSKLLSPLRQSDHNIRSTILLILYTTNWLQDGTFRCKVIIYHNDLSHFSQILGKEEL